MYIFDLRLRIPEDTSNWFVKVHKKSLQQRTPFIKGHLVSIFLRFILDSHKNVEGKETFFHSLHEANKVEGKSEKKKKKKKKCEKKLVQKEHLPSH